MTDLEPFRFSPDGYLREDGVEFRQPALYGLENVMVAVSSGVILSDEQREKRRRDMEEQKQRSEERERQNEERLERKAERLEHNRARARIRRTQRRIEKIEERIHFIRRELAYLQTVDWHQHFQRFQQPEDWLRGYSVEQLDPAAIGTWLTQSVVDQQRQHLRSLQYRLRTAYLHRLHALRRETTRA